MPPLIVPKQQIAGLLGRLVFQVHHATQTHGPDAIHDLRVSIRRFQQGLRTFRAAVPDRETRKIRRRLREVMDAAAEVRNRDIVLEFLAGFRPEPPVCAELQPERKQAYEELVELLRRLEHRKFSSRWRTRLGLAPPARAGQAPLAPPDSLTKKFFRTGQRLIRQDDPSAGDLHRLRLRTKRLRYTLEQFRAAYGPTLDRRVEALRGLQQHLGEISDCATIELLLRGRRGVPPTAPRRLSARLKRAVATLRGYWEETFAVPGEEERWLQYLSRPRRPSSAKPARTRTATAKRAKRAPPQQPSHSGSQMVK